MKITNKVKGLKQLVVGLVIAGLMLNPASVRAGQIAAIQQELQQPVKAVSPVEQEMGREDNPAGSGNAGLNGPLMRIAPQQEKKKDLAESGENVPREVETYSFEDGLAHLSQDYAAAVIVRSLSARDLRSLVELDFEVGIAVLADHIALFTSGNHRELRLNDAAAKMLSKASLIAHTHPRGFSAGPSETDLLAAGGIEYVISSEGVHAYDHAGLINEQPMEYGALVREIKKTDAPETSTKQTRDILHAFIQDVEEINAAPQETFLFRSADPNTVLPGQPGVSANAALGGYGTVDRYGDSLLRLNYNVGQAGSSAQANLNFATPQNISNLAKLTFQMRLPTPGCSTTPCVQMNFVDAAGRISAVNIPGLSIDFRQVDVTRNQILAGNASIDLTRISQIQFVVKSNFNITKLAYLEIQTAGLSTTAQQTSPEGYPVLSLDASPRPLTALPGAPMVRSEVSNGATAQLSQIGETSVQLNYTLPQTTSTAAGVINFPAPQDLSSELVLSASMGNGRQILVQVRDAANREASFYLNGSFLGSFTLNFLDPRLPAGFNSHQITQIKFVADPAHAGPSGTVSIGTQGLYYVPLITGSSYNTTRVTGLPDHPRLRPQTTGTGTVAINQQSNRLFDFQYGVPAVDDRAAAEIAWGFFRSTGGFNGTPAMCGNPGGGAIVFAVNGPAGKNLKMEIVDVNGKVADFFLALTGFMQNYSIATSGLAYPEGFDITRVAMIRFVADQANMGPSGQIYIESGGIWYDSNGVYPAVTPATQIKPLPMGQRQDLPKPTYLNPQGTVATGSQPARGVYFYFETRQVGWAGTGFTYDDFSTSTMETGNISNVSKLQFGIQGTVPSVKIEFVDNLDRKFSLKLSGIRPDTEEVFEIATSSITGIDLTKLRMIYFIVEGQNLTGNLQINQFPLGTSNPWPYQSSTEITRLPGNPVNNTVVPAGATASMASTSRGGVLTYNTGSAGWVGGGFNYDNFGTTAIETANLSGYKNLIFGLKGTPSRVKMEVIDSQDHKASVYLLQVNGNVENEWTTPTSVLAAAGVDLSRVRMIYFIVEGVNQSGTLEINRIPNPLPPNSATSITSLPVTPRPVRVAPAGVTANVTSIPRGFRLDYATGTAGWAGGGFAFDDPATSGQEAADISGLPYLGFGIKGNAAQVKFEIVDANGKKASIILTGIRSDLEQKWAIPTSVLASYGIDLTRVQLLYFIVEGANQTGSLEVYRTN